MTKGLLDQLVGWLVLVPTGAAQILRLLLCFHCLFVLPDCYGVLLIDRSLLLVCHLVEPLLNCDVILLKPLQVAGEHAEVEWVVGQPLDVVSLTLVLGELTVKHTAEAVFAFRVIAIQSILVITDL